MSGSLCLSRGAVEWSAVCDFGIYCILTAILTWVFSFNWMMQTLNFPVLIHQKICTVKPGSIKWPLLKRPTIGYQDFVSL